MGSPAGNRQVELHAGSSAPPMTLWTLLQAAVLCMNAGAILNEERFLDKCACRHSSPLVQLESRAQPFSIPPAYPAQPDGLGWAPAKEGNVGNPRTCAVRCKAPDLASSPGSCRAACSPDLRLLSAVPDCHVTQSETLVDSHLPARKVCGVAVGLNTTNLQGGSHATLKGQAAGLIHAVSYMRSAHPLACPCRRLCRMGARMTPGAYPLQCRWWC